MTDSKKSGDMTVTKKMLDETRSELKSDSASLKLEMKSGFESVKSDISRLDSKIDSIDSKLEQVLAAVHNVKAIVEDQDNRNKFVLDGHNSLHGRQDKYQSETNERIDRIESVISKMNTTN